MDEPLADNNWIAEYGREGLNFRIPGHDRVTLNACSHSPAVNKYLHMKTREKYFMHRRNKYLVLKSIS